MGIQTITTPTGEELVVMPRADYDALVAERDEAYEDGADAEAFRFAMARARPEDILPAEVTHSILTGKGRIQAYREWRSLSRPEVSSASGISEEDLLAIETGEKLMTREAAASLASALDVPFSWLAD